MVQTKQNITNSGFTQLFYGPLDKNIRMIEKEFQVEISGRGDTVAISGDDVDVEAAKNAIESMITILTEGGALDEHTVRYCISMVKNGEKDSLKDLDSGVLLLTFSGKPIKPKTLGQKQYIKAIDDNFIVFGVGPAGTGKTYLAVVAAVKALKSRQVQRIILTRPAVEAGEKLGFLPGDLQTKIDPYLRPLYDALFDTMGMEAFAKLHEKGIIEVAPLAYMRGRTLDNAFVILDEAQNTTPEQMKMFLTRLGTGSKMVVNGDITQIDLAEGKRSGLIEASRILRGIEGIEQVRFTDKDVVRFRLVAEIVRAYERANQQKTGKRNSKRYEQQGLHK